MKPKHRWFDVMREDRIITIVQYEETMSAADVRQSLINHDGYPTDISVYRQAPNHYSYAYDDCARHTHPEECK